MIVILVAALAERDQDKLESNLYLHVEQDESAKGKRVTLKYYFMNPGQRRIYISQNISVGGHVKVEFLDDLGKLVRYENDRVVVFRDSRSSPPPIIPLARGFLFGRQQTFQLDRQAKGVAVRFVYTYDLKFALPPSSSELRAEGFSGRLVSPWLTIW